jgi:hypothetical protein
VDLSSNNYVQIVFFELFMDNIRLSQYSQRPSESFVVNRSFISTTFTTEGVNEDLRKYALLIA